MASIGYEYSISPFQATSLRFAIRGPLKGMQPLCKACQRHSPGRASREMPAPTIFIVKCANLEVHS